MRGTKAPRRPVKRRQRTDHHSERDQLVGAGRDADDDERQHHNDHRPRELSATFRSAQLTAPTKNLPTGVKLGMTTSSVL
jgi:transcription elongation GreA/GreB family factor